MDQRLRSRSVLFGVLLCLGSTLLGSGSQEDSPKEQAAALAKKAKKAAKSGQQANAYLLYSEAAALQPGNKKLPKKMETLQSRAALQSKPVPTPTSDGDVAPDAAELTHPI